MLRLELLCIDCVATRTLLSGDGFYETIPNIQYIIMQSKMFEANRPRPHNTMLASKLSFFELYCFKCRIDVGFIRNTMWNTLRASNIVFTTWIFSCYRLHSALYIL